MRASLAPLSALLARNGVLNSLRVPRPLSLRAVERRRLCEPARDLGCASLTLDALVPKHRQSDWNKIADRFG